MMSVQIPRLLQVIVLCAGLPACVREIEGRSVVVQVPASQNPQPTSKETETKSPQAPVEKERSSERLDFGTVDGAGGNGTAGRMFESYIVTPTLLPAFEKHITPKLETLSKINTGMDILKIGYLAKNWFLAPVQLRTIPSSVLGVTPIEGGLQQFAWQTEGEIWFDRHFFFSLDTNVPEQQQQEDMEQRQAAGIMHELVLAAYLLRSTPMTELCRISAEVMLKNGCGDLDPAVIDEMFPPLTTKKELTREDYWNVRRITHFLLSADLSKLSAAELEIKFLTNGFDPRFFKSSDSLSKQRKQEDYQLISIAELKKSLQYAVLGKRLPRACDLFELQKKMNCSVDIQIEEDFLVLKVTAEDGRVLQSAKYQITATSYSHEKVNGSAIAYVSLVQSRNPHVKTQLGDRVSSMSLYLGELRKQEGVRDILAMHVRRGAILEIPSPENANKPCVAEAFIFPEKEDEATLRMFSPFPKPQQLTMMMNSWIGIGNRFLHASCIY